MNRSDLRVGETFLGREPNLAARPDIQRVQAVIVVDDPGMKTRKQLLMAFDQPSLVGKYVAAEQHSDLRRNQVRGDGKVNFSVGHDLHGIEAVIEAGVHGLECRQQFLVSFHDFAVLRQQVPVMDGTQRFAEHVVVEREKNFTASRDVHCVNADFRNARHNAEIPQQFGVAADRSPTVRKEISGADLICRALPLRRGQTAGRRKPDLAIFPLNA